MELSIQDAYLDFLKTEFLLEKLCENEHDSRISYEIANSLERFLLTNAQCEANTGTCTKCGNSYLIYDLLRPCDKSDVKFDQELRRKSSLNYAKFLQISSLQRRNPSFGLKIKQMPNLELHLPKFNNIYLLKFGDFTKEITVDRWNRLKSRYLLWCAENELLFREEDFVNRLLLCALKYASLLPRGQHWAIPLSEYRNINVDIEGFASPFNSQIVMLGNTGNFCSLFPEDIPLGSVGNFFKLTSFQVKDLKIAITPPYIESILSEAARMALKIKKLGGHFVFYGPYWNNAEFFYLLNKPEIKYEILKSKSYSYEDPNNNKVIHANFDSVKFSY